MSFRLPAPYLAARSDSVGQRRLWPSQVSRISSYIGRILATSSDKSTFEIPCKSLSTSHLLSRSARLVRFYTVYLQR